MNKENNNRTNTLLLTVIGVATLLVAVIGATFAFFTANLSGNETATTVTVGAGTLTIVYSNGTQVLDTTVSGIMPAKACTYTGEANDTEPCKTDQVSYPYGKPVINKSFTVTGNNTTSANMPYGIELVVQSNTFGKRDDLPEAGTNVDGVLTYTLEFTNTGGNGSFTPYVANSNVNPVSIPYGGSTVALGNGLFVGVTGGNKAHDYLLKIYFTDTEVPQDDDKNRAFTAYVNTTVQAIQTTTS